MKRSEELLGPIDVGVNVAFVSVFSRFDQIRPAEYKRTTEVSYLGNVYATMAVLKRMQSRGHGTIVQVGSALAYRSIPLQTAYCGAKHAIQGFHEALRCELLHERSPVRVTMVQMPAVNTSPVLLGVLAAPSQAQAGAPIYQPEVAARAVVFAADHPRRREYWVGTSTALTLAANAVAPGVLDRYLARTGFASQQTGERVPQDLPTNIWAPVDDVRDFGADGKFDSRSTQRAPQLVASQHDGLLGAGLAAIAALALAATRASRR